MLAKRYWYVILTYLIMQFSGVIFTPLLNSLLPMTVYEAFVYWKIFSFIVGLIVVILLMKPDMKKGVSEGAADLTTSIKWIIGGFILAYVCQIVAGFIEINLFGIKTTSENTDLITKISRITPLFLVVTSLVAPILEEIIFRKIIFGGLYKRTGFFIAALISCLIFGFAHGEPQHILIYGSMGFVLAYAYYKTKRIIVPIAIHMSINSMVLLIRLAYSPEQLQKMQDQLQMILFHSQNW